MVIKQNLSLKRISIILFNCYSLSLKMLFNCYSKLQYIFCTKERNMRSLKETPGKSRHVRKNEPEIYWIVLPVVCRECAVRLWYLWENCILSRLFHTNLISIRLLISVCATLMQSWSDFCKVVAARRLVCDNHKKNANSNLKLHRNNKLAPLKPVNRLHF